MTPQRIQLSRAKGWRKPDGAVVVSRPSEFGNPFRVIRAPGGGPWEIRCGVVTAPTWVNGRGSEVEARQCAVDMFAAALRDGHLLYGPEYVRVRLAGRDLACWCKPSGPCHGDVLLRVAALPECCPVCRNRPVRLTRVISGRATGVVTCPLCTPEPGRKAIPAVFGIPFRDDVPSGGSAA